MLIKSLRMEKFPSVQRTTEVDFRVILKNVTIILGDNTVGKTTLLKRLIGVFMEATFNQNPDFLNYEVAAEDAERQKKC